MSKLSKSLSELDAIADELLSKSQQSKEVLEDNSESKAEDLEKSEAKGKEDEDLKPEDVSENVPDEEVQNTDDAKEEESDKEDKEDSEEEQEEIKKSMPEEDKNEENLEEDGDKERLEKSIRNTFESNEDIKKSIDASEFLSAVTEVLAKSLADVIYNMQGSSKVSMDSNDVLAKSLQASLTLNKSMSEELALVKSQNELLKKSITDGFDSIKGYIEEQFDAFSHQPSTMRKSVGSVSVHERDFQKSLTGTVGTESLSKAEVLTKLNTLMYSGNPLVQPSDIISYESGAPLRPEVAHLIMNNM